MANVFHVGRDLLRLVNTASPPDFPLFFQWGGMVGEGEMNTYAVGFVIRQIFHICMNQVSSQENPGVLVVCWPRSNFPWLSRSVFRALATRRSRFRRSIEHAGLCPLHSFSQTVAAYYVFNFYPLNISSMWSWDQLTQLHLSWFPGSLVLLRLHYFRPQTSARLSRWPRLGLFSNCWCSRSTLSIYR